MKKKNLNIVNFYEDLEKQPQRATLKKVIEMMNYLKSVGYQIEAWKRFDKPQWKIYANNWAWHCRSHHEAYNHLYPFYFEEKQKEYSEYLKKKSERIAKELGEIKNEL